MNFEKVKDSGERRKFGTGAVRDMALGKGRYDLIPSRSMRRLAKHFQNGAIKYSANNWRLGIPLHSFADSALRHIYCFLEGQNDEDHACAALWNLMCLIETQEMIEKGLLPKELEDVPYTLERIRETIKKENKLKEKK
jgi:hypothetical protein